MRVVILLLLVIILGVNLRIGSGLLQARDQLQDALGMFDFSPHHVVQSIIGQYVPDLSPAAATRVWQEQVQPMLQKAVKTPDSWWDWVQTYMPELTREKADEIWQEENLFAASFWGL